jgi:maltose O-acetyltransferase
VRASSPAQSGVTASVSGVSLCSRWMSRDLPGRFREVLRRPLLRIRGELSQDVLRKRGLRLGENVSIGERTTFDNGFLWLISVGDGTTISAEVYILAHDGATKLGLGYTQIARVAIGRNVYIGARAIVLPGVTIGDGAIVGAGSVVRHDVPPGTVVAGNPARIVREVGEFVQRHERLVADRPLYLASTWTYEGGITPANQEVMRAELEDGPGYIE